MTEMKIKDDMALQEYDSLIATGEELTPEQYPQLYNLSAAFVYQFLPIPKQRVLPEYVYLEAYPERISMQQAEFCLAISDWNIAWEASQLRHDMFNEELPTELGWLRQFDNQNIYLPKTSHHRYYTYSPLFHLLPKKTLDKFGLPLLKNGKWPFLIRWTSDIDKLLLRNFDARLSRAFAYHIWPLINSGSKIQAFSTSDPIKVLAHNLDFWIPHIYRIIENRLKCYGRVAMENGRQKRLLTRMRKDLPLEFDADRPLMGGPIWWGEEEAWDATKEMIESADSNNQLREIIDAVRSHRIEDDFSACWSYAKEDFERKIYKKRSKIKVTFVELKDTIPVHGPESEVIENILWEDFIALLNQKERRIVVLLRNGTTQLAEISRILGYANHSPISKALTLIRQKAIKFLEL
jgi:hypothetical protein